MIKTKKLILAAAAATLATSAVANAGFTYSTSVSPSYYGGYDLVTFTITGWTGTDNTSALFNAPGDPNYTGSGTPQVTNGILEVSGTWSGTTIYAPGTSTGFATAMTNGNIAGSFPLAPADFSSKQGSFVNFDAVTGTSRTQVTNNVTSSVINGTWYTAIKSQQVRPVDITPSTNFSDDLIDNTVLAAFLVKSGTASSLVYNGYFFTDANVGGFQQQLKIAATSSITLTGTTAATGTVTKFTPSVVPLTGSTATFSLPGESSTGHTLVALDIVGGTLASFGSFPGTDVSSTYASLFSSPGFVPGGTGAYNAVLDLGAVSGGTLTFTLPAGVTIGGVAVVPEPTSLAGLALLGVPALARRRRA
jgi:predicted secreted protein